MPWRSLPAPPQDTPSLYSWVSPSFLKFNLALQSAEKFGGAQLLVVSVVIAMPNLPANLASRRSHRVHVRIGRSVAKRLDNLGKVRARGNALSVRADHVGGGYAAGNCAGSGALAWRRVWSSSRGTAGLARGRTAQEYHDAGRLFGKAEVNVGEKDRRLQILVGHSVAEGRTVRAKPRGERPARLCGYRR